MWCVGRTFRNLLVGFPWGFCHARCRIIRKVHENIRDLQENSRKYFAAPAFWGHLCDFWKALDIRRLRKDEPCLARSYAPGGQELCSGRPKAYIWTAWSIALREAKNSYAENRPERCFLGMSEMASRESFGAMSGLIVHRRKGMEEWLAMLSCSGNGTKKGVPPYSNLVNLKSNTMKNTMQR